MIEPVQPAELPWAWSSVGLWADRCADPNPDAAMPADERQFAWDPGFASRRVWGPGVPIDPPQCLWPCSDSPQAEAVRKLWLSGIALGCAIERVVDEAGVRAPWQGLDWSILIQGALWTLAAQAPDRFLAWTLTDDPAEKRRIETDTLGLPADAWSQWALGRMGLEPVARALWLIKADPMSVPRSGDQPAIASQLCDLIHQGFALAASTRYGLAGFVPADLETHDPRIALTEAMVRSVQARVRLEPPADEPLVRRSLALIRQTTLAHQSQARAEAATRLLSAIDADLSHFAGPASSMSHAAVAQMPEPSGPRQNPQTNSAFTGSTVPADESLVAVESRWRRFRETFWNQFRHWDEWAEELGRRRAAAEIQAQASRFESLAEFAAGAGHELNNPLAVIQGRAQLLLARAADDQTRSSLKAIVDQTLRAHRMLRDLIFIARPTEPRPRAFRPAETLKAIAREFKPDSVRRNVQIQMRIAPEATTLDLDRLDPEAYRHMATSLVRNALEASPEGGTVVVSLKHDAHGLALQIEDHGRGFDSNEARHLFDPFYCGRRAGRGLGLGLPRVARIVAQMNGKIRFRSQPGQGTVFEVIVPAHISRAANLSHTA